MEEITNMQVSSNSNLPLKDGTGPWLVFMPQHNNRCNEEPQTFYSIAEKKSYLNKMGDVEGCKLWPTSQGNWMLTQEPNSRKKICLWNPLTSQKVIIPNCKLNLRNNHQCALSSSPLDPSCKLICQHGNCLSLFDFETSEWSRHYIVQEDELIIPCLLSLNGKFYSKTRTNRLAVIDFSHNPKIIILEEIPEVCWPVGMAYQSQEYMLESYGEMFMVQTFARLPENSNIAHLVVYKRDSSNEEWNVVDKIGDRVFFLGRHSFAGSWLASKLNVKENCIYYLLENNPCLYLFDMDEGTIQVDAPCREYLSQKHPSALFWIMPSI